MPMTTKEYKPHDASILKVCLDDFGQNDFSGRIISRYMAQPLTFVGVAAMLTQMEAIMDHLGYPQKYRQARHFNAASTTKEPARHKGELVPRLEEQDFDAQAGKQATFTVRVEFRQNATWQGSIVWDERSQTLPFDSTLEMVKLMDGAVQKLQQQPAVEKHW